MGILYIIATPIGNLEDISKRALEILSMVDLILAEDTREVIKILRYYDIKKNTLSYHQHSGEEKRLEILNLLLSGKDIALVSDAGTPGISDPGNELIDFIYLNSNVVPLQAGIHRNRSQIESGMTLDSQIQIIPIPGPSAVSTALSVCGFNVSKYLFLGFWPKKKVKKLIELVKPTKLPIVFFESPHRIIKTLAMLAEVSGSDGRVFVGRELTKMHETHYRGTLDSVVEELKTEEHLKGEIVVVLE
jgi:16S rRNA (cytidine1402-2'-O)-methyltransferase